MNNIIRALKKQFPSAMHPRIFLVGGSVRDFLQGKNNMDTDLAAELSEAEFTSCGFRLVAGKSTAPIWFRHDAEFGTIEVTRLQSPGEMVNNLRLRDFTINALAMDFGGNLVDPLNGKQDIEDKRLRACSVRSFCDDPLRIFRAFRFECFGWRMTGDTKALIREKDWEACFSRIPVERFSREMIKALSGQEPERFFQLMQEFHVGSTFLPELFRMPVIPAGPQEHHPEGDLLTHSIQVLQRTAQQTEGPLARFCAFFHDIGKLATPPGLYPKHHGHEEAGFALARDFCNRLRFPASYRTALSWISRLHGTCNHWEQLRDSTKMRVTEQAISAGIIDILPLVSSADKYGGTFAPTWADAVRTARMNTAELGIDSLMLDKLPTEKRAEFILQKRVEQFRRFIPG